MEETWNLKLMDLLKNARNGNQDELKVFIQTYSPLASINDDFSLLLLFRNFKVQYWNDERRILNTHPDDENFQCGITIVTSSDNGSSQSNVYLPNNLNYKELIIQNDEITITTNKENITTNQIELFRKLKFFKRSITEKEILDGFKNLFNERYEKPTKPKVKSSTIKIPSVGELIYNEKLEWFEGGFSNENQNIEISVYNAELKVFNKLLSFIDKQMKSKFYEKILKQMESTMIELKNTTWLGEDDETGEDEPPITVEKFRKRISISSIVFYDDCTSSIYCNDDDIFLGHSIEINVDKNGKFKDANLVG